MQTTVVATVLVVIVALAECGFTRVTAPDIRAGGDGSAVNVEERFAIRYCYRQHSNQTDVNECLVRNAHLPQGRNR
jgi:hypothetical protein